MSFYNNPRSFLLQKLDIFTIGLLTLIYMVIVIILAIRLISTYRKYKVKQHLFAAFAYFGAASTWSGIAFNFIIVLMFDVIPPMETHIIINGGWATLTNFFWIMTVLSMSKINIKIKKVILIILGTLAIAIEALFIYFTFIDWRLIMYHLITPIYGDYTQIAEIFYMFQLIAFVFPGFWLSISSLKSQDTKLQLKGKLLTISFLLFTIGAIFGVFITEILLFVIGLIFITLSGIFFYIGFILPDWVKNLFIKDI